ncbi:MAG: hypothetical protein K6T31_06735 [Alicyclobacillus sp.]|nr:hypothetical protein [Alicyclobacillus sp.]
MIPYLFAGLSAAVFYTLAWRVPKRLTRLEIYCTSLFALLMNVLVDVYLDMRMNLYDYFSPGIDFIVPLYFIGIFPPLSTLYLNGFPYGRGVVRMALYIAVWTSFSLGYEWLATRTGVLTYNGWHLRYSACVYPAAQIMHAVHLALLRRWVE